MTAPRIRADYDALGQIARAFGEHASRSRQTAELIQRQLAVLQAGDWVGKGASAFFHEMTSDVLPALKRLVTALEQAGTKTSEISGIMKTAEEEAARQFKLNGRGGPIGEAAMMGLAGAGVIGGTSDASGAEAPKAKRGRPAAKPVPAFAPPTHPLPDGSWVTVYHGLPREGGGFIQGAGAGKELGNWARSLTQEAAALDRMREHLDDSKAVLAQTLKEEADLLRKAASHDLPRAVRELNRATDGAVYRLVKEYQQLGDRARAADLKASAAAKAADAALNKYGAAKEAVEQYRLKAQRLDWAGQRQEIEARIAERQVPIGQMVDLAVAAATGGAAGKAWELGGNLVKEAIGGMTEAEMRQLIELDARIHAIDEALAKSTDAQVKAELQSAKSATESAFDGFAAAKLDARGLEKAQWDTIDQLAVLEASHKTGTVFQQLQAYNSQAHWVGSQLRDQTDGYLHSLST